MDNMGYLSSRLQCSNLPMPNMQSTVPEFDRFAKFSKVHIIKLLSEVENRIWSLALKGASDQVADRFFHLMESGQEEEIRTDFKLLCNVQRKDVEEAQRYILEKAKTKGGKGMYLKIHRGTKQIGGNIVEIATETTKIILDCGLNLPPLDERFSADTIQIDGLTVGESAYDAVFITHYHADHCGLVERVNADIPIYMSNDTKVVLEIISDFINSPLPRISHILEPGKEVTVGDIKVLPLTVGHSARGSMMFLVEAGGKKLLYTGDFNHIDDAYYPLIGKVDGMLCEGTNIGVWGGITEQDIEREAARIMRETKGQVFVLCSTTNAERIRRIERACRISGRTLALDPFAKAILDRIAKPLVVESVGFVPHFISEEKTPRSHKYLASDIQNFSNAKTVSKMTNLTFLVRQTMGEFVKRLNDLTPLADSTLIYSMWRGYENKPQTQRFLDLCNSIGMRIEYLHASGHAYREMLEGTILNLKPDVLIPIHTESAELFHEMHDYVVLLEDGQILEY